jgi:Ran GTPase-activating protein (RanGAP) involved in mRNA processing and transport
MRVGDVIGVTRYMSPTSWYGEVFNTAAKHEEGEFNPKLARHLTEEELDDLLIISKHGFLECNGKKMFMVLHGGQLFRYNDTPARDKTAKQLAKAQASMPIDESSTVANVGNRKDAIRVTSSNGTTLELVGDREVIGDWLAVLQKTIARAVEQTHNVSDQRATIRVKRVQQEQQKAEQQVEDEAWDKFDGDLDGLDFSDLDGGSAPAASSSLSLSSSSKAISTPPAQHRRQQQQQQEQRVASPMSARRPSAAPTDELTADSIIDGGVPMHQLFAVAPSFGEFLAPGCYVTDADNREIERLTRALTGSTIDKKVPAAAVAAVALDAPPLERQSSRTRESVMVDLRNLKSQYEAGVLDDDSFAEAKQSLLAELTLVSGVLEKPPTPPPAAAAPAEPDEDEPAPPAKSWNDVSELDLLGDLDEMAAISEQTAHRDTDEQVVVRQQEASGKGPDWNNMDADEIFDVMLNTATLKRGDFVDDDANDADVSVQFFAADDDEEEEQPPPPPPSSDLNLSSYDPYSADMPPVPPAPSEEIGGYDSGDDLPELQMGTDGRVVAATSASGRKTITTTTTTTTLTTAVAATTARPRPVDPWEEEENERRRELGDPMREAEDRIRRLQLERQTIVVQRAQSSPDPKRRPITTLAPNATLDPSFTLLKKERGESQTAFLLHVCERRIKAGLVHAALRRQCRTALKLGQVLTELDLSRLHMTDHDLKLVAQSFDDYRVEIAQLAQFTADCNITTLRLSDNDFRSSEQNVENLRTILRATLRVKHLYLAGIGLTDKDVATLNEARFLASLPLETLDLSRNPLGSNGAARLIEGFEACHTLNTLALQMCSITDKQLSRWDALFGTPPLLHLDVSHNKLGDDGVRHVMALAAKRQRLLTLDIGVTGGRPSTAEVMAKWLNHNQQLLVLRCEGTDCAGFGLLLGKALAKHRSLQELDVTRCNLSKQLHYVIRGAGACGAVRRLHLSQNVMTPTAQQQLIKTLNEGISRFTHLYVRDCELARRTIAAIFAYAGRADSTLEHIDIACNKLDTPKLVQHVGACVLDSPSLRTLHVAATGLTNETLMPILRAARDSRGLKRLHLDGHPKAKRWLPLMTKLVATSKSGIEELTLRNCNVTEEDAIQFAEYFRTNVSADCALKLLRLERNKPLEKATTREAIAAAVGRAREANSKFRTKFSFVPDPETLAGVAKK